MDTIHLNQSLAFLAYTTSIIFILTFIIFVPIAVEFWKLERNVKETLDIIKEELVPTLKNVNKSVEILSSLIIKTDEGINKVKDFISKSPLKIFSKMSIVTGVVAKGFWSGLCTAFKAFRKKK